MVQSENTHIFVLFWKTMLVLMSKALVMTLLVLVIAIHYLYHKYYIFCDYRSTMLSKIIKGESENFDHFLNLVNIRPWRSSSFQFTKIANLNHG